MKRLLLRATVGAMALFLLPATVSLATAAAIDVVLADFEGDQSTGRLTSPAFTLERKFITFLIGGGGWANETCLNLIVAGKVVRSATGNNQQPGGSERLVQNFTASLPRGDDAFWLAAYPLAHFGLTGQQIKIAPADDGRAPEACRASFERIKIGSVAEALSPSDYTQPYRNQFHASSRRGWNNDPNGLVYHDGKYHLYYQHNPFGIFWGNMHWGHFESTDLIHWVERPIALFQKTTKDMAFSGGGFVDFNNSAGLGKNTRFVAFTSTGRGECLAYSKDGGLTFTELPENPVVKHKGRDPKVIWYQPEQKWVMVVFGDEPCAETVATPQTAGPAGSINGIDANFDGRAARIFTDRTFNEVYADGGLSYEVRKRPVRSFASTETRLKAGEGVSIRLLKIYRLRSIWPRR